MNLESLTARIKVVATSIVTFCTAAAVLVTAFVTQVTPALPDGWQDNAAQIGAVVVSFLTAVVVAIRNVSPIDDADQRGLLPHD